MHESDNSDNSDTNYVYARASVSRQAVQTGFKQASGKRARKGFTHTVNPGTSGAAAKSAMVETDRLTFTHAHRFRQK